MTGFAALRAINGDRVHVKNGRIKGLLHDLQRRLFRLIQQINRLLEPLVLHKRSIGSFCGLYRRMTQQMLNVSNRSTWVTGDRPQLELKK